MTGAPTRFEYGPPPGFDQPAAPTTFEFESLPTEAELIERFNRLRYETEALERSPTEEKAREIEASLRVLEGTLLKEFPNHTDLYQHVLNRVQDVRDRVAGDPVAEMNAMLRGGRSAKIAMNKLKKGLVPKARPNKLVKQLLLMVGGPAELALAKQMKGRERLGTLRKKYTGENPEIRLLLS